MKNHATKIQKSVRYVTIGDATARVKNLWVCLHGYGQLAVWFARNFNQFALENRFIVIPEGPHRFYLEGTDGRVGASWMTKEDRLADIDDQFYYLENLVGDILTKLPADCKIHVLGFSQGVATAFRWINNSTLRISALIAWAGTFPPDIDYSLNQKQFNSLQLHACFGDSDAFISTEKAQKMLEQINNQGIAVNAHFYAGGHRIKKELLENIIATCEKA